MPDGRALLRLPGAAPVTVLGVGLLAAMLLRLAFLRVLENPRDEVSWYRLLTLMPGIGEVTARNAVQSMAGGSAIKTQLRFD